MNLQKMNINFRKSFRKSLRSSSTFYLESIEMNSRTSKDDVCYPVPPIDFRLNESMSPILPIHKVIKYDLNSGRTTGIIGQLVLTTSRLKFIPYPPESSDSSKQNGKPSTPQNNKVESNLNSDKTFNFPPFELVATKKDKTDQDIEYLNIYDIICQKNLLQIYCSDFKCFEFQFRSTTLVKNLTDQLEILIIKPTFSSPISQLSQNLSPSLSAINNSSISNSLHNIVMNREFELTYFWATIAQKYQFNYPKDWETLEGYWYSTNNKLRISQANEYYRLCKSLPISFIISKDYVSDNKLLQDISAKMKGQRVPVITYSCKCKTRTQLIQKNRFLNQIRARDNLLIRSGIMNKEVSYTFIQAISPVYSFEVNDHLPDIQNFVSIYLKLREACFQHSNTSHFLSLIGKWMKLICKILSIVNDLSKILEEESSLLLMENNDNHWNIILSCLIQITLDRNRRTIEGFNSLISKEWIYLVGIRSYSKLKHEKLPNQILFTLFLDCVYQLLYQNSADFEFTSLYLIRCFDLSFIPYSVFVKINSNNLRSSETRQQLPKQLIKKNPSPVQFSKLTNSNSFNLNNSYHLSSNHHSENSLSSIFINLTFTQTLFFFNPFYKKNQSSNLKLGISSSILSTQFWRPLYLRWSNTSRKFEYYNQFMISEYLYFNELISRKFNFNQVCQIENESKKDEDLFLINDRKTNDLEDSFEHF